MRHRYVKVMLRLLSTAVQQEIVVFFEETFLVFCAIVRRDANAKRPMAKKETARHGVLVQRR
jgi:hypothetical protein